MTMMASREGRVLTLDVSGMSCASCAARIETELNKLPGLQAAVNYATERAAVTVTGEYSDEEVAAAISDLGFGATLRRQAAPRPTKREAADGTRHDGADEAPGEAGASFDDTDLQAALLAPTDADTPLDAASSESGPPPEDATDADSAAVEAGTDDAGAAETRDSSERTAAEAGGAAAKAPGQGDAGNAGTAATVADTADSDSDTPARGTDQKLDLTPTAQGQVKQQSTSIGQQQTVAKRPAAKTASVKTPKDRLAALRQAVIVAWLGALPTIVLSMVPAWQFDGWQWLVAALTTMVVLWPGATFHRATVAGLRYATATMDTLITVGTGAAYLGSMAALLWGSAGDLGFRHSFELIPHGHGIGEQVYFEAAAGVVAFVLTGRYVEHRARRRARGALERLLTVGTQTATVVRDGKPTKVAVADVAVGDVVVVHPGDRVPTDGVVHTGQAQLDTAVVTGESVPRQVGPGMEVLGGCVNVDGLLQVRATAVGADTHLQRMARLVEEAQLHKSAAGRLADRVAAVFVPVVLGLAAMTLGLWLGSGAGWAAAATATVAVLIIACPCAMGLATPLAFLVSTHVGAKHGVLLRGADVLERVRAVDTVVLDKTGTVTAGRMQVTDVIVAPGDDTTAADVVRRAVAVEAPSRHPIALAVGAYAAQQRVPVADVRGFVSLTGRGVRGVVGNEVVVVGRRAECEAQGMTVPEDLVAAVTETARRDGTHVWVGWGDQVHGVMVVADTERPTSAAAVAALKAQGLSVVLLTGDNPDVAAEVASRVGIDEVHSDVLPVAKADVVADLQRAGRTVAMVGDGVNDSAALARADVGIAMGSGTDAAMEAADVVISGEDLHSVVTALRLSGATHRTIHSNLWWAFFYNVVALPVAVCGLLTPMIAGAAMAASSVFVVANSSRLYWFRPTRSTVPAVEEPAPASAHRRR